MLKQLGRRTSPSTVIACLALFFAVAGGSAIALKGKNTVDSGDIKKGQVKTSDIANNAVTTKKIKGNAVRTSDIQNGQVGKADLRAAEPFHKIGTAGQPPFGNGGEGDCIWTEVSQPMPPTDPFNEPSFYKDPYGVVRLTGAVQNANGPGGDAACDDAGDAIVFRLPVGDAPAELMIFQTVGTDSFVVIGQQDLVTPTFTFPAGSVVSNNGGVTQLVFDGIDFRAGGTGTGLPRRGGQVRIGAALAKKLGLN